MNLSYVCSLFDQLKEMILIESNRLVSSDRFDSSDGSREFYYEILDIIDAVDSLKSDYLLVIDKYSKV